MPANIHSLPPLLIPQEASLSQPNPPSQVSVLSSPLLTGFLVVLGLYLFYTFFANRFDKTLHEDKHSEALTALMAIFTPTTSSWPRDILDATRRASSSHLGRKSGLSVGPTGSGPGFTKGEIRLGFSTVYEHILNGNLELQPTASVDLVKAILLERDGMEVDGWKIKVVVERKWAWRVSLWVVRGLGSGLVNLSELWNGDIQVIPNPVTIYMRFVLMVVDRLRTYWVLYLIIVFLYSLILIWTERAQVRPPHPTYALDLLPAHQHDQFTRQLYKVLRSSRPASPDHDGGGTQAIVTFSTISAPSILLSTITLCGLPFFLRTPPVEPTPVLLSLRRAIKSLSSATVDPRTAAEEGKLVVLSIEDKSETYAGALVETIKQMESDADLRQRLVDELGVRGWRRAMFCVELEAALYKAGLMKHWEVLVGVS